MYGSKGKNPWVLLLMMLAGLMVGFFIGDALSGVTGFLSFLSYNKTFGIETLELNLIVVVLRFGVTLKISLCGVIFMLLGALLYRRM